MSHYQRDYYLRIRHRVLAKHRAAYEWLTAIKMERGCEFVLDDGSVCGWREHPAALEFDHRDPSLKRFALSSGGSRPRSVLEAELAKCDVLCANHHRIRTMTEGHTHLWMVRKAVEDPQLSLFEEPAA